MNRIQELRSALAEQTKAQDEAINAVQFKDGVLDITAEHKAEFDRRAANIADIKMHLAQAEEVAGLKTYLNAPAGAPVGFGGDRGGALQAIERPKSISQMFFESEEWKAFKGSGKLTMEKAVEFGIMDFAAQAGMKDVYRALPTGTPGDFGPVQRDAMVERLHRKVRIRDLYNVLPTQASVIEFFRVTGFSGLSSASVVPERTGNNAAFDLAPQTTLSFVGVQQTSKRIAHYEAAHRNTLDDETTLGSVIENELLYGLQLREDQQLLSGNQSTNPEDLPGILNDANIQTYAQSSGPSTDTNSDAIRRALTKTYLSFFDPTGVVVHPSDWETMELSKDTTGQYVLAVSIALGGAPQVWQVPVVQTSAITAKTALVGAFGMAAQLYDRQQASIRIAEQHSDFFLRDAIVILAEERLTHCIKRPEGFVKVTLT